MSKYYRDYIWKEGIPYGIEQIDKMALLSYKIAMDPYRKRIAIERYLAGDFKEIIYDSAFLDFRHLKPAAHIAWQKCILSEEEESTVAAIYNQDDRLVLMEKYSFENKLCRSCLATSGHGIPLSLQKMYYKILGDPVDGVLLLDNNDHPVMFKSYATDETSGEFTEVLEELWDGQKIAENFKASIRP